MDQVVEEANKTGICYFDGEKVWVLSRKLDGENRSVVSVVFNANADEEMVDRIIRQWPQNDLPAMLHPASVEDGYKGLLISVEGQDKRAFFNAISGLLRTDALKPEEASNAFTHYQIPFEMDWHPAQA